MNGDMFLLAERVVIALETISENMKNISAYIYEVNSSVTYLVNEKREKECTSLVSDDGDIQLTSGAGRDTSVERNFSSQYEQADERSSFQFDNPQCGENSSNDIASTSFDPPENSEILSSRSNSFFTGGLNIEENSEAEVNDESHEMYSTCRNNTNFYTHSTTYMTNTPKERATNNQNPRAKHLSAVHGKVEPKEELQKCSVCEKTFTKRSSLMRHTCIHTKERLFTCSVCGELFAYRSSLTRHMRSHTDERPYKCETCGRAFRQTSHLYQHMRTHSREKPYKCTFCGRDFAQNKHLTIHTRIHTGERPYHCTLCGETFRYHTKFKQHIYGHSAGQPFQ